MAKISEALTYGLTIRESATDGSDFTNPAADYRRLFLGEDGALHLKDSAGAVTAVGGSADISLPVPVQIAGNYANSTSVAVTVSAPTKNLLAIVGLTGRVADSITQTNVTWTKLKTYNGNGQYAEIWAGAVSGTGGTTVTVAATGSNPIQAIVMEFDHAAFATGGTNVTATGTGAYLDGSDLTTNAGDYVVLVGSFNGTWSAFTLNVPYLNLAIMSGQVFGALVKSPGGRIHPSTVLSASGNCAMQLCIIS